MTALEIILLLIGIICVAASFIFFMKVDGPEKASDVSVELSDKQKEEIKKQISAAYQEQMDEMTDKVKENTESALEKLSNQKIQELSEYSDTVLADINKNHNEVMFLYDMLNEKSKEVHNNIRDINIAVDRFNEAERKAEAEKETYKETYQEEANKDETKPTAKKQAKSRASTRSTAAKNKEAAEPMGEALAETAASLENEPKKPAAKKTSTGRKKTSKAAETPAETQNVTATDSADISQTDGQEMPSSPVLNTEFMMGSNKKEAVLALHNEGKSNVEIAKALGLGVGEVKLVIDLFKGQK